VTLARCGTAISATVLGTSNQSVVWQIQGTPCLVAGACGAIDANGAYTAPGSAPSPDAFTPWPSAYRRLRRIRRSLIATGGEGVWRRSGAGSGVGAVCVVCADAPATKHVYLEFGQTTL